MSGTFKKFSELFGKVDSKVLEAKLNSALELLKNGNEEEIASKLAKVDKKELLDKLNELDENKLKEMNIDKKEMQKKIKEIDLNSLQKMLGENGPEIVAKLKDIIK